MNARTSIIRALGIGAIVIVSYAAGRQHQRDVVALCYATATNVRRMVDAYDAVNIRIWNALGLSAPPASSALIYPTGDSPP